MEFKHIPIMLNECIDMLAIKPDGVYVDATLGGAGHSQEIVKRLSSKGTLIGIDKDGEAIAVSKSRLKGECKKIFVNDDYKNYSKILVDNGINKVDGILIDLGVSSYQLDNPQRGFSYVNDGELDMRMDTRQVLDAKYVVNNYDKEQLIKIFYEYGEEQFSKVIAQNIINSRKDRPITTTNQLVNIIESCVPAKVIFTNNPVKRIFQAIRIEVNGELNKLAEVIEEMIESLNSGGRMCVLTFHSLEDRIVKDIFKKEATDCLCPKNLPICVCHHKAKIKLILKKPIIPQEEEVKVNKRSHSAKLRVVEKL